MKKVCPGCGGSLLDETKEFCRACEKLDLVGTNCGGKDFELLSQMVSAKLRADWKFNIRTIGSVFAVVMLVIGLIDATIGFTLKETMARHFQDQMIQATNRINESLTSLDNDVRAALAQVDIQMRSNIIRAFDDIALKPGQPHLISPSSFYQRLCFSFGRQCSTLL